MTTSRQAEIVAAWRRLGKISVVARELGIGRSQVQRTLDRAGVQRAAAGDPGIDAAAAAAGVQPENVPFAWIKTGGEDGGGVSAFVRNPAYVPPDQHRDAIMDAVCGVLDGWTPPPLPRRPRAVDADLLALYPLPDVHLGLRAWGRETGESYDAETAAAVVRAGVASLMASAPRARRSVVLIMGDFTHADDERAETPASKHRLDVDGRMQRTAEMAARLALDLVHMAAARHERVEVRVLRGNHDPHVSMWITVLLSAIFADDARVTVDDHPGEWWAHRHGACLLTAHHGHRRKLADAAAAIPNLWPELWGATRWRYFLQGHGHHLRAVEEINGVRAEMLSAICPRDSYAASMGYQSQRRIEARVFHLEHGEVARLSEPVLAAPTSAEPAT